MTYLATAERRIYTTSISSRASTYAPQTTRSIPPSDILGPCREDFSGANPSRPSSGRLLLLFHTRRGRGTACGREAHPDLEAVVDPGMSQQKMYRGVPFLMTIQNSHPLQSCECSNHHNAMESVSSVTRAARCVRGFTGLVAHSRDHQSQFPCRYEKVRHRYPRRASCWR